MKLSGEVGYSGDIFYLWRNEVEARGVMGREEGRSEGREVCGR